MAQVGSFRARATPTGCLIQILGNHVSSLDSGQQNLKYFPSVKRRCVQQHHREHQGNPKGTTKTRNQKLKIEPEIRRKPQWDGIGDAQRLFHEGRHPPVRKLFVVLTPATARVCSENTSQFQLVLRREFRRGSATGSHGRRAEWFAQYQTERHCDFSIIVQILCLVWLTSDWWSCDWSAVILPAAQLLVSTAIPVWLEVDGL